MTIEGRALAASVLRTLANEVTHFPGTPHLTVITCAPAFATQKYLQLKKQKAESVGIAINIIELPAEVTTAEIVQVITAAALQTDGVVVQLPLPKHIDRAAVVAAIPNTVDVDAMQYSGQSDELLPPVVGAIAEIAHHHGVIFTGQYVVIVGEGALVGAPAALWARSHGAQVTVITAATKNNHDVLRTADIIIAGAGVPNLITETDIKEGVVIFDAGTAEDNGELKGDAHPNCATKASLFTPVPGGIGPLTVAILLRNVLESARQSAMMEQ